MVKATNNPCISWALALLVVLTAQVELSALPFKDISGNMAILTSQGGNEYLCAIVKMDGGVFAVSSQSLFFEPIPAFELKRFTSREVLRQLSFEFSVAGDFVRIKLDDAQLAGAGMDIGGKPDFVFSITDGNGIVYRSSAGGANLFSDKFQCRPGSPVVDSSGRFAGVASRTDDGFGKPELKAAVMPSDVKFQSVSAQGFAKQAYSIQELRDFYTALDRAHKSSGVNRFIEINTDSHRQLMPWLKEQNEQAFSNSLAKPTREAAMREHAARCLHYTNLRRLGAFFSSCTITARQGRWPSEYLREQAKAAFEAHNKGSARVQGEIKSLLERYPSIKEK